MCFKDIFSHTSLYAALFLLEHSSQDHFVFSLLILLCFTVEVQIKSIVSRNAIRVPAGMKVSTCVMTHVSCLISEISFDWVSVLVVCIQLLSSEDAAMWMTRLDFKRIGVRRRAEFVQHLSPSVKWCERKNRWRLWIRVAASMFSRGGCLC